MVNKKAPSGFGYGLKDRNQYNADGQRKKAEFCPGYNYFVNYVFVIKGGNYSKDYSHGGSKGGD
jgi:hypothetical protein